MNFSKKVLSVILTLIIVCSFITVSSLADSTSIFPSYDSSKPNLVIGTVGYYGSKDVKVPVSIGNNPGILGVNFQVKYDTTSLTYKGIEAGDSTSWNTCLATEDNGVITVFVEYSDIKNDFKSDGLLFNFLFTPKSYSLGTTYPISFTYVDRLSIINVDGKDVNLTYKNGGIKCSKENRTVAINWDQNDYRPNMSNNVPAVLKSEDDGSFYMKSDEIKHQYQMFFDISKSNADSLESAVRESCDFYDGLLSIDITVNSAYNIYGQNNCHPAVSVEFICADGSKISTGSNIIYAESSARYIFDFSKFKDIEYNATTAPKRMYVQVQCYDWGCGGKGTMPYITFSPISVYTGIDEPNEGENHTHSYKLEITKQPTCTEEGVKTYTCSCGDSYTEELSTLGHKEVIDKAVAPTCTETGLTEGSHCSVCGEVLKKRNKISALGHKQIIVGAKKATYFSNGYTGDKICVKCGATISNGKTIAKLKLKTPSYKYTGDNKKLKVTYKKVTGATGFQVRYKANGKYVTKSYTANNSVTKTISLKKGSYPVQIRAVVKQSGKTAYSNWTNAKTVKVK